MHISHHSSATMNFSPVIKIFARFFSYVFHPLFVPLFGAYYLVILHPFYFTGFGANEKWLVVAKVGYNTIFFPALAVVLLKALGFIKSIFLRTQRERVVPYIASNIFYFWTYLVLKNSEGMPAELTAFVLGVFLASSGALIANIYFKISMHGLGMGALCGLMFLTILSGLPYGVFLPAMIVFLITGLVGTSRLIVSDHSPFEFYTGWILGVLSQFIAIWVVA